MAKYIPFTDEQKLLAARTDLPAFLQRHGIQLERSGSEYRLAEDPYITIRGNTWFDQAAQQGGNPISFVKQHFSCDYPGAMMLLLGEAHDLPELPVREKRAGRQKEFALPPAHTNMRRVFAYLVKHRHILSEIVSHFAKAKMLYESAEPSSDGSKIYHNAVFVGYDENGVARHAHKKGLYTQGQSYRGNIAGSNAAHSFHHTGSGDKLFVFEAPVDLMSFIALHPNDWQRHSYVALCGVSEHAMLQTLKTNPHIQLISLCLDNDMRGIEAVDRLSTILQDSGYGNVHACLPEQKDWNVELQRPSAALSGPQLDNGFEMQMV